MFRNFILLTSFSLYLFLLSSVFASDFIFHPIKDPITKRLVVINDEQNKIIPLIPISEFKKNIEALRLQNQGQEIFLKKNFDEFIDRTPPPASYSLGAKQTRIKDQLGRGTCWAFASVAGLEAYYLRQFGVNLDLSEQYTFHMAKAGELYPDYVTNLSVLHENNSSHWGFQGNSGIVQSMQRFAIPDEASAPYLSNDQMNNLVKAISGTGGDIKWESKQEQLDALEFDTRHIPLNARLNAKYQITSWSVVDVGDRNTLNSRLEQIIASNKEVVADFTLKWKWNASKNYYDWDAKADEGGHVMLIIGYDRNEQVFTLKNSWGGNSYVRVSYEFMKNAYLYGHTINGASDPRSSSPQIKASWIGNWNMDHDGWRGKLVIRRFTNYRNSDANAATKLGSYYRDGKGYDVNGYFRDNGQTMIFWIADTTNRVNPGATVGQQFIAHLFSWDKEQAAGKTTWNGTPYGMILSRGNIPYQWGNNFNQNKWIGNWNMNHDGWRGTLTINSINPNKTINASYRDSKGNVKTVTGQIDGVSAHKLNLNIQFDSSNNQAFELLFHTWTEKTFSGTTKWGASEFGVEGFK